MSEEKLLPKAQQLKQIAAMSGNAKAQDILPILGKSGEKTTLTKEVLESRHTLYFKNLRDCDYTVTSTCTKVLIEDCNNCTFTFNAKVITCCVEIWSCENSNFHFNTSVLTLQADLCKKVQFVYDSVEHFNRLIWAAVYDYSLEFIQNKVIKKKSVNDLNLNQVELLKLKERRNNKKQTVVKDDSANQALKEMVKEEVLTIEKLESGFAQKQAEFADLNERTDQFIVRVLKDHVLTEELVVRLNNGFPTTEREAIAFDEEQARNREAMEDYVRNLVNFGGKKLGLNRLNQKKVPRNSPCPCGSGKKYKVCCGSGEAIQKDREEKAKLMEKEFEEKRKLEEKAKWKKPGTEEENKESEEQTKSEGDTTTDTPNANEEKEEAEEATQNTTQPKKKKKNNRRRRGGKRGRGRGRRY